MNTRFTNKVAIVTGAATGIGYQICLQLAQEGAQIILNDLNDELSHSAADRISQETKSTCVAYPGDASNVTFIYQLVDFAVKQFGKVDLAIANAGITLFGSFMEFTEDSFQKIVNLNLQGSFFLTQAFAKQIERQKSGGTMLLMSSNIGYQSYPNLSAYGISKAGIRMMARTLVSELSPLGIRINAVAPGATLTERTLVENEHYEKIWGDITPLKQIAHTDDIANMALFLLSSDARHITGQTIIVDGGWEVVGPRPKN